MNIAYMGASIRFIGLLLILALLSAFVGCSSANALISNELKQSILSSGDDVSSFKFEGTMSMNYSDQSGLNMTMDYSGAIDVENMNMKMAMSGGTANQSIEIYAIACLMTNISNQGTPSHIMYMLTEVTGQPSGWINMEVPHAEWEEQDQLAQQLEVFSFGEVRHNGSDTIEGTDCHMFDIVLDTDELIDFTMRQPGMKDSFEGITTNEIQNLMSDATIKIWVDKNTNLPVKQQMQFRMTIEGIAIDVDMTMSIYDYNVPVNITIPRNAIRPDYQLADAYYNRAMSYSETEEETNAMADFEKAIELDPNHAGAYNGRGYTYYEMNDLTNAIADFERAIELDPSYTDAYYNRGISYYQMDDLTNAMADFEKAIELDPNHADAYYNRGKAYLAQGEKVKAMLDFGKAIDLSDDPDFIESVTRSLGRTFPNSFDYDEAIYADQSGLFSIAYPTDWVISSEMTPSLQEYFTNDFITHAELEAAFEQYRTIFVAGLTNANGLMPSINISVEALTADSWTLDDPPYVLLNDYVAACERTAISLAEDYYRYYHTARGIAGQEGIIMESEADYTGDGILRSVQSYALVGNTVWTITCSAPPEYYINYRWSLMDLVVSLQIYKPLREY
ncbi:MAG: tetratricopeptide repeat protein [Chloroflexi bacterium]|jgi:tetratricopeptide (TPR) repeat protein|nr:tetratricopeptide repeat protein [Chloroflexota bacterium]MBT7080967.1 tetratricopeptide repeat protein [Chloroflexota bacterium]MBT7290080.1 tetratricopeptide repeat protein [Chloroflexota bacterium]